MHAAMRGHGTSAPSGNILKARAVEQGSRIVAAPPDDIFVVLELPRGNLETIYPRSLVLPAVAAAVQVNPQIMLELDVEHYLTSSPSTGCV